MLKTNAKVSASKSSKSLRFGHLERVITNVFKGKIISVVSVIGRQSGGKSYLMNRLWGSRFSVAATRCTDGIWLSVNIVENNPIIVMDCEGLFSERRTDTEEIKLLTLLSAICDITFLN